MPPEISIMEQFDRGAAVDWNTAEFINDILYDNLAYAAAGQLLLNFFAVPVGAGATLFAAAGTKTFEDTNLEGIGNHLSKGEAFLAKGMGFDFVPGVAPVVNTYAAAAPAAARVAYRANDMATFYDRGWAEFRVLNKYHVRNMPIRNFPPFTTARADFGFAEFYTQAAAVNLEMATDGTQYAPVGSYYGLAGEGVRLEANMRFFVSLQWTAVVAMPSGAAGRVTAQLFGKRLRVAQ